MRAPRGRALGPHGCPCASCAPVVVWLSCRPCPAAFPAKTGAHGAARAAILQISRAREGPRRAPDPAPSGAGQRIIARMDRYERILSLHRILKTSRYPVTVARLQEELECSRATVYRDLAFLRDALMAPVVGDGEAGFRYDAEEGGRFELPGLWLNSDELHALLAAQQLLSRSAG